MGSGLMSREVRGDRESGCIYCGSKKDMTVDHIPPKSLFPEPCLLNMLTVPCCGRCNRSFSKDDEYFRTILVSHARVASDPNVQAVNRKLLRSVTRPAAAGMASVVRKSLHLVDVVSPGGIYLGTGLAMRVSAERINRTIDRIAAGLFYVIRGYPVPARYEVTCVFKDVAFSMPGEFIAPWRRAWRPPKTIGRNVFNYSYAPCVDDPDAMLFIYWFYNSLWFYGHILPGPVGEGHNDGFHPPAVR